MAIATSREGPREPSIAAAIAVEEAHSFVDWGAIFAGSVLAAAVATLLLVFGSAIGLSLTSAYPGRGLPPAGLVIAGGLWLLWVEVSCFLAGGYLAGRLRRRVSPAASPHEVEVRDGSHGLLVWAVCLVVGALITGVTITGVVTLGAGAAAGTAAAADPTGYYVDSLLRPAGASTPATDAERQSISRILAMNPSANLADDDKAYLAGLVASRTGLPPEEAVRRVDEVVAKARAAAEEARKYGIILAFLYAASMLASAGAAWWAATLGGKHRDERTDYSRLLAARR